MRIVFAILSIALTVFLIVALSSTMLAPVPLGKLLSPQEGIWQNTENVNQVQTDNLKFPGLKGSTEVYLDDRMVPHIFAENDEDAYFAQGYLHAKYRLWQMEFQTIATAGRLSEFFGEKALDFDRKQRRLGIVYAAEKALELWEKDPETKAMCDAYTAGINAYITNLPSAQLPLEYKLLGYAPEKWTNLKSVLFFKAMTYDLAGYDTDFENTNLLKILGEEDFHLLFPEVQDSISPIIPKGTPFSQTTDIPLQPTSADSIYFHRKDSVWFTEAFKPDPDNGSNNWAISGSKTRSGKPILCNDPHLGITLPSIWYEIQISTPSFNAYGVSFPGLPGVVIGFNDNIAFGFTNAGRDMKDYYEIKFRDDTKEAYWFNNKWLNADQRIEHINVKGKQAFMDTVAYTVFGPVMYDKSFQDELQQNKAYALRWIAHFPSNPMRMWYELNRAKNYTDYLNAIRHFNEPAQNMLFASKDGDIAIWQQGNFPLRWNGQGSFVMPGSDSSYMWTKFIPQEDNPHIRNPEQGYISSANQRPVDSTYPYFIPGSYDMYRGISINRRLSAMNNITPDDMKKLQTDNYNVFAEQLRPVLLKYVDRNRLTGDAKRYTDILAGWNLYSDADQTAPTIFQYWYDSLSAYIFKDEILKNDLPVKYPEDYILAQYLIRDTTSFKYIDNVNTPQVETLSDMITSAIVKASEPLSELEANDKLAWGQFKNTTLYHLLRTNMMPFARTNLNVGGGDNIINATKHAHGPSWRMIVSMTTPIEAYGVYPGGQSGNPGSYYYDDLVNNWASGKYYRLWIMKRNESNDKRIKAKMTFSL
jgi:penicillin amidase